jgi:type IV pilus assembly protein PilA
MTMPVRRHGFTYIEVLLVLAMASILAAIGLPRFFEAQKHAKQSEAISNLKLLHAGLSTQTLKPSSIHVPGFNPKRGNSYSYHLGDPCTSFEDRSGEMALANETDTCIGVDTYAHPTLPPLNMPAALAAWSWFGDAMSMGLGGWPGLFGTDENWHYLAMAAADLDGEQNDPPDTWAVGSSDGFVYGICPTMTEVLVTAGEPFVVAYDLDKKCF